VPVPLFGVSDETDLSEHDWRKGDYDTSALTRVCTADGARVRIVLRELQDKIDDVRRKPALGFCVSVAHAEYTAAAFNTRGVPAVADSRTTRRDARATPRAA
jgi:superfamily II DNA or RNA helicase